MDERFRPEFNEFFTADPTLYPRYLQALREAAGTEITFRLAETPLFLPAELRARLARYARALVDELCAPSLIEKLTSAIPPHLDVPRRDSLANCIQVDLAITRDAQGELDAKLVELQGFPSLYSFTGMQAGVWSKLLADRPAFDGKKLTPYFSGLDEEGYRASLGRALLGGEEPEHVIMLDLTPSQQKTYCDFTVTKQWYGIDSVDPLEIQRDGRTLFRTVNGRKVPVKRIYNRVVFDELERKGVKMPFKYTDDLDVTWVPHPNWYWIWSKCTIPHLKHPCVPRSRLLSQISAPPEDLHNYVLKPLFSFAGAGVKVDVTRADLDAVPEAELDGWLLQEKIEYAPALVTPQGQGVKAEVRMMFLREPNDAKPKLVINLVRLSRGKMLGVDQNRDLDWVGGTVGLGPVEEAP